MIDCFLWPVRMAFQRDAPEKEKLVLKRKKKKKVCSSFGPSYESRCGASVEID